MKIPIYYLDAFTEELFSGNPAAVIFSDIEDSKLMQQIATENNLSETYPTVTSFRGEYCTCQYTDIYIYIYIYIY